MNIEDQLDGARRMRVTAGDCNVTVMICDSVTSDLVWEALPIEASGNTWGDEIYFSTGIQVEEEDSKDIVDIGTVGFWPPGSALCLFFGPTPSSEGDEIRPASPVNIVGWIEGDYSTLKQFQSGDLVVAERI